MRLVYACLLYLLVPLVILRLLWRSRLAPDYRQRWAERFAFYPKSKPLQNTLWIHAVSVGEAEAAFPLIKRLQKQYPQQLFLVTCTTPTGSSRIQAVLGTSVTHVYLPYDLPDAVQRFLNHYNPRLAIIMETEIWPNLFHHCQRRNIPVTIVNARLSERSQRGYERLQPLTRTVLNTVSRVVAQTPADAQRYIALGANRERVSVTGNLKFDLTLPDDLDKQAELIRHECFRSRPLWIVASTHEGEDEKILSVLTQVQAAIPDILLAIAPRHPERFSIVADLCKDQGFSTVLRSQDTACQMDTDVFILDTLGELKLFYAAADVAFVGGSLVPTGGHNVLEAAALGLPILSGPHTFNFKDIIKSLHQASGLIIVEDQSQLTAQVIRLMQNQAARQSLGQAAQHFVECNRGALKQVCSRLTHYL